MANVPTMTHVRVGDALVVEGPAGAPLLRSAGDLNDVIGECFGAHTTLALLYAENLPPAFFDVSSRQAGEILQKLRNYGLRLAVVVAPGGSVSSRFHELQAAERRDGAFDVFDSRDAALAWLTSRP
jgi:hypothetical protein